MLQKKLLYALPFMAGLVACGPSESAKKTEPSLERKPQTVIVHSREYNFRGATLGIPLDELRSAPFPDVNIEPKTKLICSTDKESKSKTSGVYFFTDDAEKKAGVVECQYFSANTFTTGWERSSMSIGTNGTAKSIDYKFVPDPRDQALRLYAIVVTAYAFSAESAINGINQKFGSPTMVKKGTVQNRMGANFDHQTLIWTNPLSAIVLECPSDDVDTMVIVYTESRLSKYVSDTKNKIQGSDADKM